MGSIYYPTGDLYEGQCVEGVPEGEGRKIWKDGSHYIGYFKEGCMEGQGRIRRSDKFTYEGTWKNNTPHGKGVRLILYQRRRKFGPTRQPTRVNILKESNKVEEGLHGIGCTRELMRPMWYLFINNRQDQNNSRVI